ncbi:MAG: hypothetical protein EBZ95_15235, partial [Chitinophagia bacterium]|nr:hypothetical protein [Chitinophagia bacterium]
VNILNYFKSRKNSGFVEGLNNKIKVLKRRWLFRISWGNYAKAL